jgi:hypothetical protein
MNISKKDIKRSQKLIMNRQHTIEKQIRDLIISIGDELPESSEEVKLIELQIKYLIKSLQEQLKLVQIYNFNIEHRIALIIY